METLQKHEALTAAVVESLVLNADLSKLTPAQKVEYVRYRCSALGLDPAAKPFELLNLSGKQVLYATAACTQQLCESRKLSVALVGHEMVSDVIVVTAKVSDKERSTENVGAVSVGAIKGDALANALMKARTKAIRRTVLAHCGLGMLDETETETIPNAVKVEIPPVVGPDPIQAAVAVTTSVAPGDLPIQEAVVVNPGDFVTPFGTVKGTQIKNLNDEKIRKGIAWCRSTEERFLKYGEWVANAEAFLNTSVADQMFGAK
jgi:hypothetical protein